jgi:hypothetical protein
MNEKILVVGISLILLSLTLIGFTALGDLNQNTNFVNVPIFTLLSFNGIWDFHHPNASGIGFELDINSSGDENIEVQLLLFFVFDEQGNTLLSFRPHTDLITLRAHENITLSFAQNIFRNSVSEYCWNFLGTYSNNVRVSGVYRLNGELNWFESNLCEVDIPICK